MSEFLTIKRINKEFIQPDQSLFSGIEIRGRFGKRSYPDPIQVNFNNGVMKIGKDSYKTSSFTKTFDELKSLVIPPTSNDGESVWDEVEEVPVSDKLYIGQAAEQYVPLMDQLDAIFILAGNGYVTGSMQFAGPMTVTRIKGGSQYSAEIDATNGVQYPDFISTFDYNDFGYAISDMVQYAGTEGIINAKTNAIHQSFTSPYVKGKTIQLTSAGVKTIDFNGAIYFEDCNILFSGIHFDFNHINARMSFRNCRITFFQSIFTTFNANNIFYLSGNNDIIFTNTNTFNVTNAGTIFSGSSSLMYVGKTDLTFTDGATLIINGTDTKFFDQTNTEHSGMDNSVKRMFIGKNVTLNGSPSFGNTIIERTFLPTYANNAAAVSGGLYVNEKYKTATGELRIVV